MENGKAEMKVSRESQFFVVVGNLLLLNTWKYGIIAFVEVTCERARAECYEYQAPWSSG